VHILFIELFFWLKTAAQDWFSAKKKKKKVDIGVEKTRKPPKMSIFRGFAHSRGNRARKLVRQRKFSTFIGGEVA
jgi:hypothetical protein